MRDFTALLPILIPHNPTPHIGLLRRAEGLLANYSDVQYGQERALAEYREIERETAGGLFEAEVQAAAMKLFNEAQAMKAKAGKRKPAGSMKARAKKAVKRG